MLFPFFWICWVLSVNLPHLLQHILEIKNQRLCDVIQGCFHLWRHLILSEWFYLRWFKNRIFSKINTLIQHDITCVQPLLNNKVSRSKKNPLPHLQQFLANASSAFRSLSRPISRDFVSRNSSQNCLFWKSPTSSCFTCFANCMIPFSFFLHRLSFSPFFCFFLQSLSQNIQTSDGIHSQHKQMNILQTITSNGGALQVIQAQTVQKSSSRRAITSTTYSSHFSSNFTNGVGHGSFSSGHPMSSDLLVRLISVFLWSFDWSPFVSFAQTHMVAL